MNANAAPLWTKSFILCLANNLFLFIFYFAQTTILPIYILKRIRRKLSPSWSGHDFVYDFSDCGTSI